MALHLEEGLNLADGKVLPVTKGDQLIKGTEKLIGIPENLPFVQALAGARHNLGKEVEGVDVLQNVGLAVGDEDHIQLIQWLVDKADIVLLDCSVLGAAIRKLGEGKEQCLQSRASHLVKGPGQDGLAPSGADGSSEHNHFGPLARGVFRGWLEVWGLISVCRRAMVEWLLERLGICCIGVPPANWPVSSSQVKMWSVHVDEPCGGVGRGTESECQ